MIIGIEFNKVKTPSGKTFYRVAPYLDNVNKTIAGSIAFILVAVGFFVIWGSIAKANNVQDNSHIKPWSTYYHDPR